MSRGPSCSDTVRNILFVIPRNGDAVSVTKESARHTRIKGSFGDGAQKELEEHGAAKRDELWEIRN